MSHPLPLIPAEQWNATVEQLARKLGLTFGGRDEPTGFRHPWHVAAVFNVIREQWEISVQPGFVNLQETAVPPQRRAAAPERTRARLPGEATVRPWLSEAPWIPVRKEQWRKLGPDALASTDARVAPDFFRALGVGDPPTIALDPAGTSISVHVPANLNPEEKRFLRAVDVILSVPKPSITVATAEVGDSVEVSVGLLDPPLSRIPAISLRSEWVQPPESLTIQEQLATGQPDTQEIEWRIATVYLLSPPGAVAGGDPGPDWIFFPAQAMHWNRHVTFETDLRLLDRPALSLVTGLAGGLVDPLYDSLLDPINEADVEASLLLSRAEVKVDWWDL